MRLHISKTSLSRIGLAILVCAVIVMICFGLLGYKKEPWGRDLTVIYIAGQCWWNGNSPYDLQLFLKLEEAYPDHQLPYPFVNPPQIAPLCLFLSLWSLPVAKILMMLLNIICLVLFANGCWELIKQRIPATSSLGPELIRPLIAAMILGSPDTANALWTGQTVPVVAAAIVWGWVYSDKNRSILSGILLGISTIKPQLSLLIILWYMLERRFLVLAIAAITILIASIVPLMVQDPFSLLRDWQQALLVYRAHPYNQSSDPNVFGLATILNIIGIHSVHPAVVALVGIALTMLLWRYRRRYERHDILAILLVCSVLFMYSRNYDIIATVPLFGSLLTLHSSFTLAMSALFFISFVLPYGILLKLLGLPFTWSVFSYHIRLGILFLALVFLLWNPKPQTNGGLDHT